MAPPHAASRPTALARLVALACLLAVPAGAAPPAAPRWRPADRPSGAVVALAYEPGAERLAVADRGAVWLGPARGRLAPVHRARGVRDVAFDDDGALWIAGAEGLHRWADGRARRALAPTAGGGVARVRHAGGAWLAAASDGLRWRRPSGPQGPPGASAAAGRWVRLDLPLPAGAATALAIAATPRGLRVGVVVDGMAHWLRLEGEAPSPAVRDWTQVGTSGTGSRSAADVWLDPGADAGWTLLRDGCLVGVRTVCAPLPPGARARRLFHVGGRWWLATDRGLLGAPAAEGPWRREPPPLGSLEAHAVAGAAGAWFVGTERGLLVSQAAAQRRGARAPGAAAPSAGAVSDLPAALLDERGDPPLESVRRAALAYLELGAPRLRRWRQGVGRRGWLPTVALRLDHDRDVSRRDDFDEAFVSGGLRSLFDHQDDRSSGFEASLSFEWDLGDVLHHPESVDVSRETRELVELRDDVLDEIHHLYFERRRVLLELLALPGDDPLEAARLRLRADELAAGIDAWTGGWFGRHAVRLAP